MTLHIGDNYGALLQCYALRYVINKIENCNAEIINYDPGREFPVYSDDDVEKVYEDKLSRFIEFAREYCGVEGTPFTDINDDRAKSYDYYITGSDQVWNTGFSFADESYFLNFVSNGSKRISYAASISIPETSPKLNRKWFEDNIPLFDHISIREKTHKTFMEHFTDKSVHVVADPTMLLSIAEYEELCEKVKYPDGDYLVLYFLKHDNSGPLLIELANMISRKYSLKVMYSFADVPKELFKNESNSFFGYDPREFVQLIKHAKMVITNSFHGTVLSLKFHIPFYTFVVGFMASRITDLLEETNLSDRIARGYVPLNDHMMDVDFTNADKVINSKVDESLLFLKEALDEV